MGPNFKAHSTWGPRGNARVSVDCLLKGIDLASVPDDVDPLQWMIPGAGSRTAILGRSRDRMAPAHHSEAAIQYGIIAAGNSLAIAIVNGPRQPEHQVHRDQFVASVGEPSVLFMVERLTSPSIPKARAGPLAGASAASAARSQSSDWPNSASPKYVNPAALQRPTRR
jgi:hypothetical protein